MYMKLLNKLFLLVSLCSSCSPVLNENNLDIKWEHDMGGRLVLNHVVNDKYPYVESYARTINGVVYPRNESMEIIDNEGRLACMKKYIAETGNVTIRDEYGLSALVHAAAVGDVEYVKYLHQAGIKVDKYPVSEYEREDFRSKYPVIWAIFRGQRETLLALLDLGYSPVGADVCIEKDDLFMLRELVKRGALVNDGAFGEDLPYSIILAKSYEMVSYLQQNGCSLSKAILYAKKYDICNDFILKMR